MARLGPGNRARGLGSGWIAGPGFGHDFGSKNSRYAGRKLWGSTTFVCEECMFCLRCFTTV